MRRIIYILIGASAILTSCQKWTETENMTEGLEKRALEDLRNKRDNAKWEAEAQRTEENKKALEAYWAQLREYKEKAWLNTGETGGQKPFFYFWYSGGFWTTQKGFAKTWLQSIPDSVTCISMWGGLGTRPEHLSENQKKDLEIFHKKGSKVLMCWQTPSVGLGLPVSKDGKTNGYDLFHQKYPYKDTKEEWGQIYARELCRYIIALGFDGYDVDWETCGDHGSETDEGTPLMTEKNSDDSKLARFVKEMAKYFGPVGPNHLVKTQAEREANIKALFSPSTPGFHPKEKEFIDEFTPYLPKDYLTKRYYFCADVPCGVARVFELHFTEFFDKHFMQDYNVPGVGSHIKQLGGKYYNSTSANYQAGNFRVISGKAHAIKTRQIWGFGAYHGQTDYEINDENNEQFKTYLSANKLKRKYLHYAWTRECIRISDPRPDYSGYVEKEPYIVIP